MMENEELDLWEGVDEDGNPVTLRVDRYFYYNGDEYVYLTDDIDPSAKPEAPVQGYIMKVVPYTGDDGEEYEDFEPVEEELNEALIQVVRTNFRDDSELQ